MARVKLGLIALAVGLSLALALGAKFILFAPKAGWPLELEIRPLKPELVAVPGEFITQIVGLTYKAREVHEECIPFIGEESYILSLKAPDNWQVLGLDGVNPISLRLGESRRVFLTLRVPPLCPPGRYPLSLQAEFSWAPFKVQKVQSPSGEAGAPSCISPVLVPASFIVRVKAVAIPKVEPLLPRVEVDPERERLVIVPFKVTNIGNARGAFRLEAAGPPDWGLPDWQSATLKKRKMELSPGESQEIRIMIVPPSKGAPARVEEVTLKAAAEGYEAEAKVKVTVLPH
jgi:hypothetical protein